MIDVIFGLQNMESSDLKIPGLKLSYYRYEERTANFDLNFQAVEKNSSIFFSVGYSTELFKKSTIEAMIEHFQEILAIVLENPNIKLSDIILSHELLTVKGNIFLEEQVDFGF